MSSSVKQNESVSANTPIWRLSQQSPESSLYRMPNQLALFSRSTLGDLSIGAKILGNHMRNSRMDFGASQVAICAMLVQRNFSKFVRTIYRLLGRAHSSNQESQLTTFRLISGLFFHFENRNQPTSLTGACRANQRHTDQPCETTACYTI